MSARDEAAGGVWQPIETAPEGEEVLIGVFLDDFEDPIIQNSILLDGEDKGMYWSDWHGMPKPTHWMRFSRPGHAVSSPRDQASGGDLPAQIRKTTEKMASSCSVDMTLWNAHSNACLQAADEIERLCARDQASSAMLKAAEAVNGSLKNFSSVFEWAASKEAGDAFEQLRDSIALARSAGIEPQGEKT